MKKYIMFISNSSGENFASAEDLAPQSWHVIGIALFSLIGLYLALTTCLFLRRTWIGVGRIRLRAPDEHKSHGMSHYLVKALPFVIFTSDAEDNCTSATCSICLEDYSAGEKLRILPCCHKFHAICVDMWLTSWRTFCPVCKRDARLTTAEPPPSQFTPLLSSSNLASTTASSIRSPSLFSPPSLFRLPSHSRSIQSTPCDQYYGLWLTNDLC